MIRAATAADAVVIAQCIYDAFGDRAEVELVQRLLTDKDVLLNLVAEHAGAVVGHIMVSTLTLTPSLSPTSLPTPSPVPLLRCGGVAPLSVSPPSQRQGFGYALMTAVIEQSRSLGLDALFLLGDPAYYHRFGFQTTHIDSDYDTAFFQALALKAGCLDAISAKAVYADAFKHL